MKIKNYAVWFLYTLILFVSSCEPVTEYIEVEKEVLITEYVTEEVEIEVLRDVETVVVEYVDVIETVIEYVDREVIVTEYVDVEVEKEIIITKYVEVDNIIEVITEVEVEKIVETEKIIEVEVEVIQYVDVPVVETVVKYVDRVETLTEYVEVEVEIEKIVNTETVIEIPVEVTVIEYVDRIETVTEYVDRVETVVEFVEIEKIVNNDIIVDNVINTETIIYVEREVYIMAEQEIFAQAIKEYDNYITTVNKVLGVTEEGFEEIPLIKGLFKIDSVLFFTIDELFYSQESGTITEIEESDFPEVPRSEHFEFESGNYKIQNSVYGDDDISKVYNGSPNVAYYMVDGACLRGSDLIYSTPIDTGTRYKGIYLWTVNGNPQLQSVLSEGRIW